MNLRPRFHLVESLNGRLVLESGEGHRVHLFVLEHDIFRVVVLPFGRLNFPRTWAIAPGQDDVAYEGRDRFDLSGFSLPRAVVEADADRLVVQTAQLRLTVLLTGFYCIWETKKGVQWQEVARDRATQGYNFGWWDHKVYHYLHRAPDERYYGLGERTGDANRSGHSYRMCNLDAMGYDARTTDPLYKHLPFYLTWKPTGAGFGLFYDTVSDCTFDLGRELDNYHGPFRSFVADHGDLDYYVLAGNDPASITRRFTWLTGRPALMPKWSLGYSGSTMSYTDAPNAQERMNDFIDLCRENDILIDSFHLSSGYTSIDDKRYVFHWNRDKFPDPKDYVQHLFDNGIRLCANIKPCLLRDHPRLPEAVARNLLVRDPDGSPTAVQFWDETGAYIDFTQPAAFQWWKDRVKDSLLDYGVAATWNDNNEFEIWSSKALAAGFGSPFPAFQAKPLQTLLMIKASREAQIEHDPERRPFLVSRSGTAGMQRYVQTWSGDNYTSWETLKYNVRMGTGLAASGISNIGHDIGGFAGPRPEPELFLRWVQFGILLPRFSIHSWNDDGSANEPWMYPELTPRIRDLIRLRYRLLPHLYNLLWRYHRYFEPVVRPTYFDFPDDPVCFEENDEMMVGRELLFAPVVENGALERKVYLPAGCAWFDFWNHRKFEGAQHVTVSASWDRPPLFAREGSMVPINQAEQHFDSRNDERAFLVFPPAENLFNETTCFEDDGISPPRGQENTWFWSLHGQAGSRVVLQVRQTGNVPPGNSRLVLYLPEADRRTLEVNGRVLRPSGIKFGFRTFPFDLGDPSELNS